MKVDLAKKYESQLKIKFSDITFNKKYMFTGNSYSREFVAKTDTWDCHEMVILDNTDNVVGYVRYSISRECYYADSLLAINFTDNKYTFSMGIYKIIFDMFTLFNLNKLNFSVIVGNPIEESYDKMTSKLNGRIVGTFKKDTKLIDGQVYDKKHYEISREDFLESKTYQLYLKRNKDTTNPVDEEEKADIEDYTNVCQSILDNEKES